jgi:hypothetical protein
MDVAAILVTIGSSLGGSLAIAWWVAQEFIKNRLQRDLERTKSELQSELAREKALVDGVVRKEVETQLGDLAAQRQYELEARRRLYLAIGALRSQLLLACRDLTGRVESMGLRERFKLDLAGYYGRSTAYRILRPVAIAELIEEQVALADFLVDPAAVDFLRFRRTLTRIFSSEDPVGDHPQLNWQQQEQHVFADSLSSAGNVLIDRSATGSRVLRFKEFDELLTAQGPRAVAPFDRLLNGFEPAAKPIFWVRLVAYANACNELVKRAGGGAFETRELPVQDLLTEAGDDHINANLQVLLKRLDAVKLVQL